MDPLSNITTLAPSTFPQLLRELPKPPKSLEIIGTPPPDLFKYICVVGSRRYSSYGQDACRSLILGLAGYPIVIVSGLAHGIDTIAHEAALEAGLITIAFPGSGLDRYTIHPQTNVGLARRIVHAGGALLSPFNRTQTGARWTFPVRNELMASIAHATLIVEAGEKSGTLITARAAGKLGRDVLVVPGSIFSPLTKGAHALLRDGATVVTTSSDILEALGLDIMEVSSTGVPDTTNSTNTHYSVLEQQILEKMEVPIERDQLIRLVPAQTQDITAALLELELKGVINERHGMLMKK